MILFLDLETAGLRPTQDSILEVGVILTDDALVELARFHRVLADVGDPFVRTMHATNGLWEACAESKISVRQADSDLAELLERWKENRPGEPILLAGNSVHFDRSFMAVDMTKSLKLLHYRQIDVSSLNEMALRFAWRWDRSRPKAPSIHRAMPDVEHSLETARYYAARMENDA